jgi:hypothetical protein
MLGFRVKQGLKSSEELKIPFTAQEITVATISVESSGG